MIAGLGEDVRTFVTLIFLWKIKNLIQCEHFFTVFVAICNEDWGQTTVRNIIFQRTCKTLFQVSIFLSTVIF